VYVRLANSSPNVPGRALLSAQGSSAMIVPTAARTTRSVDEGESFDAVVPPRGNALVSSMADILLKGAANRIGTNVRGPRGKFHVDDA
jgi:hypothetical protein